MSMNIYENNGRLNMKSMSLCLLPVPTSKSELFDFPALNEDLPSYGGFRSRRHDWNRDKSALKAQIVLNHISKCSDMIKYSKRPKQIYKK